MKRTKQYIFLLALCVVFATCKKNPLPPDDQKDPVFYVRCQVDGATVNLEAGKNEYYMYSSHFQNSDNVYVYKAELKQKSCSSDCGYNVTILINDSKVSAPNGVMKPDSGLFVGKYGFNDGTPEPIIYKGSFTPISQGSYTWTYSDGGISNDPAGTHYFRAGKDYSVGLLVSSSTCYNYHANDFRIASQLSTIISGSNDLGATPMTYTFTSSNSDPNVALEWDFGDGSPAVAGTSSVVHTYDDSTQGFYIVRLKLSKGSEVFYSYYQVSAFVTDVCTANFNSYFIPQQNIYALGAVTILVTDANGMVYSSESLNQALNNKMEIISVEDYEPNSENNPTKKLKIKFSCDVKNGNNVIKITNGEAVIAVSYK
jgi:hypothetical protein